MQKCVDKHHRLWYYVFSNTEHVLNNATSQPGGETVSEENRNRQELQEIVSELLSLPRDELMKTYGFALGLKAQDTKTQA